MNNSPTTIAYLYSYFTRLRKFSDPPAKTFFLAHETHHYTTSFQSLLPELPHAHHCLLTAIPLIQNFVELHLGTKTYLALQAHFLKQRGPLYLKLAEFSLHDDPSPYLPCLYIFPDSNCAVLGLPESSRYSFKLFSCLAHLYPLHILFNTPPPPCLCPPSPTPCPFHSPHLLCQISDLPLTLFLKNARAQAAALNRLFHSGQYELARVVMQFLCIA